MEIIELDLDNENEMMFKVQIEATRPGDPLCRLMIEGKDISHSIQGNFLPNDEVSITVPPMKGILKEGNYNSYLEVFVDDIIGFGNPFVDFFAMLFMMGMLYGVVWGGLYKAVGIATEAEKKKEGKISSPKRTRKAKRS